MMSARNTSDSLRIRSEMEKAYFTTKMVVHMRAIGNKIKCMVKEVFTIQMANWPMKEVGTWTVSTEKAESTTEIQ